MARVFVTGGSGFIAAHIITQLLSKGYTVTTTVRSKPKGDLILAAHPEAAKDGRLSIVVVADITNQAGWDQVLAAPGLRDVEVVMHTASPFTYKYKDAKTDLLDPAVQGTTSILEALGRAGLPALRRVVVTSSFAALLQDGLFNPNPTPAPFYTEEVWNPVTLADLEVDGTPRTAYRASKALAERAAWAFVDENKGRIAWDLCTVLPPLVYGPVGPGQTMGRDADGKVEVNESLSRFAALLGGAWRDEVPPTGPVNIWVDVRDVARAHVLAAETPGAGGRRLFTVAGEFTHAEVAAALRERVPDVAARLLPAAGKEARDEAAWPGWDNSATREMLGMREWVSLERSVEDTVRSLMALGLSV